MFDSDLLDRLSRVHPTVPLFIFIPATLGLIWQQTQYPGAPPAAPAKK